MPVQGAIGSLTAKNTSVGADCYLLCPAAAPPKAASSHVAVLRSHASYFSWLDFASCVLLTLLRWPVAQFGKTALFVLDQVGQLLLGSLCRGHLVAHQGAFHWQEFPSPHSCPDTKCEGRDKKKIKK